MTLATLPLLATSPLIRVVCSLIGVLTWQADLHTEGRCYVAATVLTVVGVGDCLTPPMEQKSSRKLTTLELSPKQRGADGLSEDVIPSAVLLSLVISRKVHPIPTPSMC
jgi:hypothetical protein